MRGVRSVIGSLRFKPRVNGLDRRGILRPIRYDAAVGRLSIRHRDRGMAISQDIEPGHIVTVDGLGTSKVTPRKSLCLGRQMRADQSDLLGIVVIRHHDLLAAPGSLQK